MKKILLLCLLSISFSQKYVATTIDFDRLYLGYKKVELEFFQNGLDIYSQSRSDSKYKSSRHISRFSGSISYLINNNVINNIIKSTKIKYSTLGASVRILDDIDDEIRYNFFIGINKEYEYKINKSISIGFNYNLVSLRGRIARFDDFAYDSFSFTLFYDPIAKIKFILN